MSTDSKRPTGITAGELRALLKEYNISLGNKVELAAIKLVPKLVERLISEASAGWQSATLEVEMSDLGLTANHRGRLQGALCPYFNGCKVEVNFLTDEASLVKDRFSTKCVIAIYFSS